MDVIRYSLGVRFGAPGTCLVLDLCYCVTETQRLDVAVSFELGPSNFRLEYFETRTL